MEFSTHNPHGPLHLRLRFLGFSIFNYMILKRGVRCKRKAPYATRIAWSRSRFELSVTPACTTLICWFIVFCFVFRIFIVSMGETRVDRRDLMASDSFSLLPFAVSLQYTFCEKVFSFKLMTFSAKFFCLLFAKFDLWMRNFVTPAESMTIHFAVFYKEIYSV